MTFDQLEAFEMIVKEGSFKAAAEALHKTQPSLSVAIRKLEEEFDLTLFNRETYRPQLTDEGRRFYEWAERCLQDFRDLNRLGRELGQQKVEPSLTVVLDPLVEFAAVASLFEECLTRSVTELHVRTETLDRGMTLLLENEIDFAIAPFLKPHADIESLKLETIALHPYIARSLTPALRTGQGLLDVTQIVVTADRKSQERGEGLGFLKGSRRCFVSDHALKRQLILAGLGWGRLSVHEVENAPEAGDLVRIESPGIESFQLEMHVMRNRQKALGPTGRSVWNRLRMLAAEKQKSVEARSAKRKPDKRGPNKR